MTAPDQGQISVGGAGAQHGGANGGVVLAMSDGDDASDDSIARNERKGVGRVAGFIAVENTRLGARTDTRVESLNHCFIRPRFGQRTVPERDLPNRLKQNTLGLHAIKIFRPLTKSQNIMLYSENKLYL